MGYYKIGFRPAEPYFLGNEKNFKYPGQNNGGEYANSYFIRGENVPSQTTILGSLRFLLLPYVKENFDYTAEEKTANEEATGKCSFQAENTEVQSFGWIKQMSPVFLTDHTGRKYIPCPMDHRKSQEKYSPFKDYKGVNSSGGERLYAADYSVKDGLEDGYLCLETCEVIELSDIFRSVMRIGINRGERENGFFKKEYKLLDSKYAFSVLAEIGLPEERRITGKHVITMGQGKSPFSVEITEVEDSAMEEFKDEIVSAISSEHRHGCSMIYCPGDAFVNCNPCEETSFAAYSTRDYRAFTRSAESNWKVNKGSTLFRMLKAGSIFLTDKPEEWIERQCNPNAQQIGFNQFIIAGGK